MSCYRDALQAATRRGRAAISLLGLLVLAGCAGTPQFTELNTQVVPPAGLELAAETELQVRLSDAEGTLAQTHVTPSGSGPWPVTLRFDRRTLEATPRPQLSAELRQQGSLTHVSPEPVAVSDSGEGVISLPLAPRP